MQRSFAPILAATSLLICACEAEVSDGGTQSFDASSGEQYFLDADVLQIEEQRARDGNIESLDRVIAHYEYSFDLTRDKNRQRLIDWLVFAVDLGRDDRIRDLFIYFNGSNMSCDLIEPYTSRFLEVEGASPAAEFPHGSVSECYEQWDAENRTLPGASPATPPRRSEPRP